MGLRRLLVMLRHATTMYNLSRIPNPFYDLFTGGRKRPVFFDIDATCPELRRIDAALPAIREELVRLLPQSEAMSRYHELDSDLLQSSGRLYRDRRWNVFMLFCYDSVPEHNRALCPQTAAALDAIPTLNQAFFSILDPGKSIPAHTGPSRTYLRYHLALLVPKNDPPSIRIHDQHYTWKEGESVLFDDSWDHEVTNHADGIRAVLIVDIMRPFPRPIFAFNRFMRRIPVHFYGPGVVAKANEFRLQPPEV